MLVAATFGWLAGKTNAASWQRLQLSDMAVRVCPSVGEGDAKGIVHKNPMQRTMLARMRASIA
jgi:hypothetical protein